MPTLCSRIVIALSLSLSLVAMLPCASKAQTPPSCTTATVQTPLGPICGLEESLTVPGQAQPVTVSQFLGIRYAQAARWKNPVAPPAWSGTFNATQFGSICAQNTSPQPSTCTVSGSEDCLFLNIYVPGNAMAGSKLPVMVFIHGGGFVNGAGSRYDGSELAASGNVIVVTINYRLGPLGFMVLPPITDNTNNNFGFRDQIMALQWVKSNISSFGGDAGNVTIFGESAGAMSVGLHALVSPQSRGLFNAAIMESNPLGLPYQTLSGANTYGNKLSAAVSCTDAATLASCMGQVTADTLACAPVPVSLSGFQDLLVWVPVIDSELITGQPMASAAAGGLTVPMILGTNLNEGDVFADLVKEMAQLHGVQFGVIAYGAFISDMFGLNSGVLARYPCAFGSTDCSQHLGQLITDYMFTCANRNFAKTVVAQTSPNLNSNRSLYLYQFTQVPPKGCNVWQNNAPECAKQVCHGQEVPYVFDTPQNVAGGDCVFGTTNKGDQMLSNTMEAYWSNFAKGQNPNASGLFQWPAFAPSGSYIILNQNLSTTTTASSSAAIANCDFWDQKGYEGLNFLESLLESLKSQKNQK